MKQKFNVITSTCVPLQLENVDTDQIIPARFLKATTREESFFGDNLFRDWRYNADGTPNKDFVLNNPEYSGCILVVGKNFGSGSSEAVESVKPVPARRDPDDHAEGYGGDGVCGREGMDRAVCQTRCQPHHRPAHGAAGISAQGGAERVCPQRQLQRDGRHPAADVQAYAQGRKQNDLPGFPIFQTFQPPP